MSCLDTVQEWYEDKGSGEWVGPSSALNVREWAVVCQISVSSHMNEESQEGRRLINFIVGLPEQMVINLLSDPSTCRTFIRLLSPLAQHFLFRLLMLPVPMDLSDIRCWSRKGDMSKQLKHEEAFGQLRDSHLLTFSETSAGTYQVKLREEIRQILLKNGEDVKSGQDRSSLFDESRSSSVFGVSRKRDSFDAPYIDEEVLDDWAASQLEKILL